MANSISTSLFWQNKMKMTGTAGKHSVDMDAKSPIGEDSGFTPKELVAVAISGCTGMDVVSLMKKYKQPLESFVVTAEVSLTEKTTPTVFKDVYLTFNFKGNLDQEKVVEAVRLSQTKYCGVTAMIVKAAPVRYKIILNGSEVATGEARFGNLNE